MFIKSTIESNSVKKKKGSLMNILYNDPRLSRFPKITKDYSRKLKIIREF